MGRTKGMILTGALALLLAACASGAGEDGSAWVDDVVGGGVDATIYYSTSDTGGGYSGSVYPSADTSVAWEDASSGSWGESYAPSNLKAGDYDDNANFADYLDYLEEQEWLTEVHRLDVSERYVITVRRDELNPVPDAELTFSVQDEPFFVARASASGRVFFHPRASGLAAATPALIDVTVRQGQRLVAQHVIERSASGGTIDIVAPEAEAPAGLRFDIALCIDTTGSMGDEIAELRGTWQTIVERISALSESLELRLALVTYRDRGDVYVVRSVDFSSDVDGYLQTLRGVDYGGGGDTPEDLQAALAEAVERLDWREEAEARILFTLADAPPHLYSDETPYSEVLLSAVEAGLRIHAIGASGSDERAEYIFRQFGQFTGGHFLFLTYANDIPGEPGSGTGSGGDDGYVGGGDYVSGSLDDLVVALVSRDILAITHPESLLPDDEVTGEEAAE